MSMGDCCGRAECLFAGKAEKVGHTGVAAGRLAAPLMDLEPAPASRRCGRMSSDHSGGRRQFIGPHHLLHRDRAHEPRL
jgi:hypothetical protein